MVNDSSTGGPLLPTPGDPAPLTGAALYAFLQGWVATIVGLPGNMVRVYDQAEPPSPPDAGTAWAALRVSVGDSDTFPFVGHNYLPGIVSDVLQRHENLDLLASFYDLGSQGIAQDLCLQLRDGLSIGQNLEPLVLRGMGFGYCGTPVVVPTLLKGRWQYRMDLPFVVRRQVMRSYPVLDVTSAGLIVVTDTGVPELPVTVNPTGTQLDLSQPANSQFVPNP